MKKVISILLLTFSFTSIKAADVCYYTDLDALQDFYNSTNGDNWTDTTGWTFIKNATAGVNVACPAVDPQGITSFIWQTYTIGMTSYELRGVSDIDIIDNNLTGTLPATIGNFSHCQSIDLSYNQLSMLIPSSIGDLNSIKYLYLEQNKLNGSIPTELGNLGTLEVLSLGVNELTGSIPTELGNLTALRELWLGENNLTGTIPSSLGTLNSLEHLELEHNQLTGSIPVSLGNVVGLKTLGLNDNLLTGTIPYSFYQLSSLTGLYLFNNDLEGCYAPGLSSLCSQLSSTFVDIDHGNPKLLSTFSDFCSTGKGACLPCDGDINLVSTTDDYDRGVGHFYSSNSIFTGRSDIIATNKLTNNTNITYSAAGAVFLEPGFEVNNGAVFKAKIGGCSGI